MFSLFSPSFYSSLTLFTIPLFLASGLLYLQTSLPLLTGYSAATCHALTVHHTTSTIAKTRTCGCTTFYSDSTVCQVPVICLDYTCRDVYEYTAARPGSSKHTIRMGTETFVRDFRKCEDSLKEVSARARFNYLLAHIICSLLPCSPPFNVRPHIYFFPHINPRSRSLRSQVVAPNWGVEPTPPPNSDREVVCYSKDEEEQSLTTFHRTFDIPCEISPDCWTVYDVQGEVEKKEMENFVINIVVYSTWALIVSIWCARCHRQKNRSGEFFVERGSEDSSGGGLKDDVKGLTPTVLEFDLGAKNEGKEKEKGRILFKNPFKRSSGSHRGSGGSEGSGGAKAKIYLPSPMRMFKVGARSPKQDKRPRSSSGGDKRQRGSSGGARHQQMVRAEEGETVVGDIL